MGKFKAKHKDKIICAIRKKHISRFLILAVLMVAGIFLILPASTAQGWPFDAGEVELGASDRGMKDGMAPAANQPPVISDLESSPSSPQLVGSTVRWTARARDPEGEPLSFLFQVKGHAQSDLIELQQLTHHDVHEPRDVHYTVVHLGDGAHGDRLELKLIALDLPLQGSENLILDRHAHSLIAR